MLLWKFCVLGIFEFGLIYSLLQMLVLRCLVNCVKMCWLQVGFGVLVCIVIVVVVVVLVGVGVLVCVIVILVEDSSNVVVSIWKVWVMVQFLIFESVDGCVLFVQIGVGDELQWMCVYFVVMFVDQCCELCIEFGIFFVFGLVLVGWQCQYCVIFGKCKCVGIGFDCDVLVLWVGLVLVEVYCDWCVGCVVEGKIGGDWCFVIGGC